MVGYERPTDFTQLSPWEVLAWFNELSGYDFLYLKDNKSVIKYYWDMIVDEFDNHDPETKEYECLCEIHSRLLELLLLLD